MCTDTHTYTHTYANERSHALCEDDEKRFQYYWRRKKKVNRFNAYIQITHEKRIKKCSQDITHILRSNPLWMYYKSLSFSKRRFGCCCRRRHRRCLIKAVATGKDMAFVEIDRTYVWYMCGFLSFFSISIFFSFTLAV